MPRKKTLLPIGIHLNPESVHLVQLEQSSDGTVSLVSRASQPFYRLPSTGPAGVPPAAKDGVADEAKEARYQEVYQFAHQIVTTDGFRGSDAVISLPADSLIIQHVRMAPMQPEELSGALVWELQKKLPYDPKEAVIRHVLAGTVSENNERKQDVIALATRRSLVEKYVSAMARIGLHVIGVSVEPCAMCHPYAFAAMHATALQGGPRSQMIALPGPWRTHVAIVQGQETIFVKDLEFGMEQLTAALAKAREISFEEALSLRQTWLAGGTPAVLDEAVQAYNGVRREWAHFVDEIESCMRYYASLARGARVDRLLLVGDEARDKALVRVLGSSLSVPCEVGDPLGTVSDLDASSHEAPAPELAVAVGLSLFQAN